MRFSEIVARLQKVNFSLEQARAIADILQSYKENQISRDTGRTSGAIKSDLHKSVRQFKLGLVKWIIFGVLVYGGIVALLKYLG